MKSIRRSQFPEGVTEEMLRQDKADYRQALIDHARTEGIPAPLPKYLLSPLLDDDFVIEADPAEPPVVDPNSKEQRAGVLRAEIDNLLLDQLEFIINYLANDPNSPRELRTARSELVTKKQQLVDLER